MKPPAAVPVCCIGALAFGFPSVINTLVKLLARAEDFTMFDSMGPVFLLTGLMLLNQWKGWLLKKRRMMRHGEPVRALIKGLDWIPSRGQARCRVVCEYREEGQTYRCASRLLWGYPLLTSETVMVYRNPRRYKDYYVDIEPALGSRDAPKEPRFTGRE